MIVVRTAPPFPTKLAPTVQVFARGARVLFHRLSIALQLWGGQMNATEFSTDDTSFVFLNILDTENAERLLSVSSARQGAVNAR